MSAKQQVSFVSERVKKSVQADAERGSSSAARLVNGNNWPKSARCEKNM